MLVNHRKNNNPVETSLQSPQVKMSLVVFFIGIFFLLLLRWIYQPFTLDNLYFQEWSSEDMMQTVSIEDLKNQPWESLFYLHIQPPLLDGLRSLLAQVFKTDDYSQLLRQVDLSLYNIWTVLYGVMGVIIFNWLCQLLSHRKIGFFATLIFYLHPAAIFYVTFLEGTFLTSLGVLWLMYALWKLKTKSSIWPLLIAYLFLVSLRSIFQWPALVILVISLILLRIKRRQILTFFILSSLFVVPYMVKQYLLFGTTSTSSFYGSSCFHSLGIFPDMGLTEIDMNSIEVGPLFPFSKKQELPDVLSRSDKFIGKHNFNHLADLQNEKTLLVACKERIFSQPIGETLLSYIHNTVVFFQPSSDYYTPHAIVDRLPWLTLYEEIFSGLPLFFLLVFSCMVWLLTHTKSDLQAGVALVLPVVYIFATCVLFEKIENMRYKFFIEPVLFIFIVSQLVIFYQKYLKPGILRKFKSKIS